VENLFDEMINRLKIKLASHFLIVQ